MKALILFYDVNRIKRTPTLALVWVSVIKTISQICYTLALLSFVLTSFSIFDVFWLITSALNSFFIWYNIYFAEKDDYYDLDLSLVNERNSTLIEDVSEEDHKNAKIEDLERLPQSQNIEGAQNPSVEGAQNPSVEDLKNVSKENQDKKSEQVNGNIYNEYNEEEKMPNIYQGQVQVTPISAQVDASNQSILKNKAESPIDEEDKQNIPSTIVRKFWEFKKMFWQIEGYEDYISTKVLCHFFEGGNRSNYKTKF